MTTENRTAVRLFVASHDGHSLRVAERLEQRLAGAGLAVTCRRLEGAPPPAEAVRGASLVVVVAAVRYGRHLPEAEAFLRAYKELPEAPPLAFASVNLTARKPEKQTAATNPYVKKLLKRLDLQPVAAAAVAGKLDYPRYRWRDRQIIRFIMLITGGPTAPSTVVEYTDWDRVDAFGDELASLAPAP
ncbi:MAG: menaquinone-dependent protoporphyrinogen IX dehydrogenase [Pseudomonadota bacterium]